MNDLRVAIESNEIATVKSLLADNPGVVHARIADLHNSPLLVLAAERGRAEIVALLLDTGARIDDVNGLCESAWDAAARNGHTDVVAVLLAREDNVARRNPVIETLLFIAIDNRNERLVTLLVDATMTAGTCDNDTLCYE